MHGVVFRGRRYDTGDRADYLKAVVRLACERPDLGPEFRRWLRGLRGGRARDPRRPAGEPSIRSVDEHLRRVLADLRVPEPIELALLDAQGLLCAEDVSAERAAAGVRQLGHGRLRRPRRGRRGRAPSRSPVVLPVVGDIPAGSRAPRAVSPGPGLRIMAGAPMPGRRGRRRPGGVDRRGRRRGSASTARPRPAATSAAPGTTSHRASSRSQVGTPIGPAQIGLLAAVGRERVLVRPRPRVVVLSTGSELVDVGPAAGRRARSSTSTATRWPPPPATPARRSTGPGSCRDDQRRLLERAGGPAARGPTSIVTSGGVSAGPSTWCKEALSELGTVRVRPGGDAARACRRASARSAIRGHPDLLPARATRSARWSPSRSSSARRSG